MNEAPNLIPALLAGVLLGTIFFGGLWWTIRRAISSPRPAVWFFGSLLLRAAIALAGFFFVAGGDWRRLLACLLGFILGRSLVTRLTRAPVEKKSPLGARGGP